MTYKEEQEFLERAFITEMLFDHGIVEVTTRRQYENGTREFEFPVSTYANTNEYYKKWLKSKGMTLKDTPRLRIACFKSGYVRKQNGTYSPYQLNKQYKQETRTTFLIDGKLQTRKSITLARAKIWSGLARLNYMLEYYLKNYKSQS